MMIFKKFAVASRPAAKETVAEAERIASALRTAFANLPAEFETETAT